jgi:hypothetical protein
MVGWRDSGTDQQYPWWLLQPPKQRKERTEPNQRKKSNESMGPNQRQEAKEGKPSRWRRVPSRNEPSEGERKEQMVPDQPAKRQKERNQPTKK